MNLTSFVRRYRLLLAVTVLLVLLLAVMQPWSLYFLNDDFVHIPLSKRSILVHFNFFRPVPNIFTFVDAKIWGINAGGYHVTSFLLHVIGSLSVFFLSKKLLTQYFPSNRIIDYSYWTALLFLVYPFHSEPLFWIIGRVAILAFITVCWSLYCFCDRNRSLRAYLFSLVFFLIGLLTYESTWVVPVLIFFLSFLDVRGGKSLWKTEIKWIIPYVAVFLCFQIVRFSFIGGVNGFYSFNGTLFPPPLIAVGNGLRLFFRTLVPPFQDSRYFVAASALCSVCLFFVVARAVRKGRCDLFMVILALCAAVSYIPMLPFGIDTHDSEGERFLYLPSFFVIILLLTLFVRLVEDFRYQFAGVLTLVLVGIILLGCSGRDYRVASRMTRSTIEALRALPDSANILFGDVPTQYRGALIFRMGLKEGINWLLPPVKVNGVSVLSKREVQAPAATFKYEEETLGEFLKEKGNDLVIGEVLRFKKQSTTSSSAVNSRSFFFYFTDSTLIRVGLQ